MLTRRQAEIFTAYRNFVLAHRKTPTLQKLCDLTGTTSKGAMHKHVQTFAKLGLIDEDEDGTVTVHGCCPSCGAAIDVPNEALAQETRTASLAGA